MEQAPGGVSPRRAPVQVSSADSSAALWRGDLPSGVSPGRGQTPGRLQFIIEPEAEEVSVPDELRSAMRVMTDKEPTYYACGLLTYQTYLSHFAMSGGLGPPEPPALPTDCDLGGSCPPPDGCRRWTKTPPECRGGIQGSSRFASSGSCPPPASASLTPLRGSASSLRRERGSSREPGPAGNAHEGPETTTAPPAFLGSAWYHTHSPLPLR